MRNDLVAGTLVGLLTLIGPPVLAQAFPSGAEPVFPAADLVLRLSWENTGRSCRFVDQGLGRWVETDKDGRVTFRFEETSRNVEFVELFDRDRGYTLRLCKNAMYMKGEGPRGFGGFAKYYDGRWVK